MLWIRVNNWIIEIVAKSHGFCLRIGPEEYEKLQNEPYFDAVYAQTFVH